MPFDPNEYLPAAPVAPVATAAPSFNAAEYLPAADTLKEAATRYGDKAKTETDPEKQKLLQNTADAAGTAAGSVEADLNSYLPTPTATPAVPESGWSKVGRALKYISHPANVIEDTAKAAFEAAKGVAQLPPALMSLIAAGDPSAPSGSMAEQGRAGWQEIGKGADVAAADLAKDPTGALLQGAGSLVSPGVGQFLRTGETKGIEEKPGELILGMFGNAIALPAAKAPLIGALVSGAAKARPVIANTAGGARMLNLFDRGIEKVISKYNFTPGMYGAEAAHDGSLFHKLFTQVNPTTREAADLIAQTPEVAPHLTPEMRFSAGNIKKMNEQFDQHMGPAPFEFHQNDLHVVIDHNGNLKYGGADEFNKLSPADQTAVFNIRTTIDANHQALYKAGMLTEAEYQEGAMGYAHKTYRTFHNQENWIQTIQSDPAYAQDIVNARAYIAKGMKNPLNVALPATPEQIDAKLWSILKYSNDVKQQGPMLQSQMNSAVAAMIGRKNVPAPIQNLMGKMEREFAAVSVGHTLDMQNKALAWNSYASRLATERAFDGNPLLVQAVPGKKVGTAVTADGRAFRPLNDLGPDSPVWGDKWRNAQVHPDIIDAVQTIGSPTQQGWYHDLLQSWKTMKVVNNPPSHINNVIGDVMYTHLVGASAMNPANAAHYAKATADLQAILGGNPAALTPELTMAMQLGAVRPGAASAEMGAQYARVMHPEQGTVGFHERFRRIAQNRTQQHISTFYDLEDQVFRYGSYLKLTADGMSPANAAVEVNKYFPSYSVTSATGQFLRGQSPGKVMGPFGAAVGGPFTSYPFEATRISLLAAKEHPFRLATANSLPLSLTMLQLGASNMTLADYHRLVSEQPSYKQGRLLIPLADMKGGLKFVDWTQAWPMGDWNTRKNLGSLPLKIPGTNQNIPLPEGLMTSGPAWSALDMLQNMDSRTGRPIVDPNRQSAGDWGAWLLKQVAPTGAYNLASRLGHSMTETQASKAEQGVPSMVTAPFVTMAPQFFKTQTTDELQTENMKSKRGLRGEIQGGFKTINKDRTLSPAEKNAQRENLRKSRQSLMEGNR